MKILCILIILTVFTQWSIATTKLTRPFAISDLITNSGTMGFYTSSDGNVLLSLQAGDRQPWSAWVSLGPDGSIGTGVKIVSSPVGVHCASTNQTRIFAMASNGQVYSILQNPNSPRKVGLPGKFGVKDKAPAPTFGKWAAVGNSSLPYDAGVMLSGFDSVQVGNWNKQKILVFARSMTNESNLYWS